MAETSSAAAPEDMRLIIISGLSGSGKSVALHALEDLGYYCIDNMPAALLQPLLQEVSRIDERSPVRVAVGVDARNRQQDLESLPALIDELRRGGVQTDLLFLQASDDILLKRYSETRRRHPLDRDGMELRAAIEEERELLGQVINAADLVIDTSRTSAYELADAIRQRVAPRERNMLSILIQSFGYKHGIPADADFVFDLRCLPNPYWQHELRALTGHDEPVGRFLDAQPAFVRMFDDILAFLLRWIPEYVGFDRAYLTIAIGCTGGRHRSVFTAERLAEWLRNQGWEVSLRHRDMARDGNEGL